MPHRSSSSTSSAKKFAFVGRILLHVTISIVIVEIGGFCDIIQPFLGVYLPVGYYSTIGLAVPWEFYASLSFLLVVVFPIMFPPETTYIILLVLAAVMSGMVGWQISRSLIQIQEECNSKKDDDANNIIAVAEPVAPGLELDTLRWLEKQQLRERKSEQQKLRTNAIVDSGVPLRELDAVV